MLYNYMLYILYIIHHHYSIHQYNNNSVSVYSYRQFKLHRGKYIDILTLSLL